MIVFQSMVIRSGRLMANYENKERVILISVAAVGAVAILATGIFAFVSIGFSIAIGLLCLFGAAALGGYVWYLVDEARMQRWLNSYIENRRARRRVLADHRAERDRQQREQAEQEQADLEQAKRELAERGQAELEQAVAETQSRQTPPDQRGQPQGSSQPRDAKYGRAINAADESTFQARKDAAGKQTLRDSLTAQLLAERWRDYRGDQFEDFVGRVFHANGIDVLPTPASSDQGVDIVAYCESQRIAIQVQGMRGSVGNSAVQNVCAGVKHYECGFAAVITNSRFSKSAILLAKSSHVWMIAGANIPSLIKGTHPIYQLFDPS